MGIEDDHDAEMRRTLRFRLRAQATPWLLVLPAALLFASLFLLPMLALLASSFYKYDPNIGIVRELTVTNYAKFLTDEYYLQILLRTIKLAGIVTGLAILLGYPVAYYLTLASARTRMYVMLAVLSPLLVSMVVRALGWVIILGPGGMLPSLFQIFDPRWASRHLIYTEPAVVVGLLHVDLPFMILAIYGSLQSIDPNLNRAASNLGADPLRRFLHVTLPLSLPGVLAGSVIVFSLSASSFVTPGLLGGASVKVIAYLIWEQQLVMLNWPFGAAVAFILLAMTTFILLAYQLSIERAAYAGVFR